MTDRPEVQWKRFIVSAVALYIGYSWQKRRNKKHEAPEAEELTQKAIALEREGKLREALRVYEDVVEQFGEDSEAGNDAKIDAQNIRERLTNQDGNAERDE